MVQAQIGPRDSKVFYGRINATIMILYGAAGGLSWNFAYCLARQSVGATGLLVRPNRARKVLFSLELIPVFY